MNRKITIAYYKNRIKTALTFIEKHLDDAIDLEQLAAVASFSPYHFGSASLLLRLRYQSSFT